MSIRAFKIGISGSLAALIACGIWFVVTGQTEIISQRANDAHANYLASERARESGVTVAEMKRRAYAGCNFPVKQGDHPGLFGRDADQADADTCLLYTSPSPR